MGYRNWRGLQPGNSGFPAAIAAQSSHDQQPDADATLAPDCWQQAALGRGVRSGWLD